MRTLTLLTIISLFISACKTYEAKPYDFPQPVDTVNKPINMQDKKNYAAGGDVFASNEFDGARLNAFEMSGSGKYRATIRPENAPINNSPYYAFKIWGETPQYVSLELNYPEAEARHRYWPKISWNCSDWVKLDSSSFQLAEDSINAFLQLEVSPDTLWVAAQEIQNSSHVREWCLAQAAHTDAEMDIIGKSKLGRDIPALRIGNGDLKGKDVIVILSRQHPPEVTGYYAMQTFVEEILEDHQLAVDFRKKYQVLVYPILNPDGVDLGHWRHNVGGVDLNRDWAYYHQPETRQVANHIVRSAGENKAKVVLGLDFHSTWYDVYYTNRQASKLLPNFKDYWIYGITEALGEVPNEKPSNVGRPVSKNWFITQFGAEGVTYEIGDDTPREFIREKGKTSALEMMKLLIMR